MKHARVNEYGTDDCRVYAVLFHVFQFGGQRIV
jgi:hypothetical protein